MPFVKKSEPQGTQPPTDARKIFIGREGELHFFVQSILKPGEPTHNIVSISGQGGVGKSTLLLRLIAETRTPEFKDYCLAALVDERQITPVSIMEKFAEQLHIAGEFEKALQRYKEANARLCKILSCTGRLILPVLLSRAYHSQARFCAKEPKSPPGNLSTSTTLLASAKTWSAWKIQ